MNVGRILIRFNLREKASDEGAVYTAHEWRDQTNKNVEEALHTARTAEQQLLQDEHVESENVNHKRVRRWPHIQQSIFSEKCLPLIAAAGKVVRERQRNNTLKKMTVQGSVITTILQMGSLNGTEWTLEVRNDC